MAENFLSDPGDLNRISRANTAEAQTDPAGVHYGSRRGVWV